VCHCCKLVSRCLGDFLVDAGAPTTGYGFASEADPVLADYPGDDLVDVLSNAAEDSGLTKRRRPAASASTLVGWGSRGRRFKSGQPDGENPCGAWVLRG
jgi:hypothetical protein